MKRSAKIWLIVAAALSVLGLVTFGVAIAAAGFDLSLFSTVEYETNTYEISESFEGISIITDTADIIIENSDDGKCRVVCYEESKATHSVTVKGDTLTIEASNDKKWYEYIGVGFESTSITVYLPDRVYGDLSINVDTGNTIIEGDLLFESINVKADTGDVINHAWATEDITIKTDTGDITVEDVYAGKLELDVSTGRIFVSDVNCVGEIQHKCSTGKARFEKVNCKSFTSSGDTGDISLTGVLVTDEMNVKRDTGKVVFDSSDAAKITVKTSTGDVIGSLLTEKVFEVSTSTGDIDLPESTAGGKCKITTSTGDVNISIAK